jgi:hypothetical protein
MQVAVNLASPKTKDRIALLAQQAVADDVDRPASRFAVLQADD